MVSYSTGIVFMCGTTYHLGCNCYKTIMTRQLWVTQDTPKPWNCS